ncbi:MAG: hypothetical protein A3H39_10340 [candidate division NC10 bacterium RIFCSPLOWO2_02_FULL_66_22]|nr:MAG: hypothetical protein A3H39_10340 [candidate division NC10 bacterium RIFCSPLOWO2_02_FULL_66_22]
MTLRRVSRASAMSLGSVALLTFCGIPLVWMLFTSLKPMQELFTYPPRLTGHYTFGNFTRLFRETYFLVYLKNSIVVAGATVILNVVIATLGAYSLTRYRYVGKEFLANMTLFTYMFAPIMIIIPVYMLLKEVNLINSHLGIILAYTSISLPFTLWLLRAFFQGISMEMEEAAFIDGASRFQSLVYIVMPQALPGIIATSVFAFVAVWNDYLFARILLSDPTLKTMPVGLQDIYESTIVDWGLLMSGAVIITIPAMIFFLIVQRFLIQGWGMGAVKG